MQEIIEFISEQAILAGAFFGLLIMLIVNVISEKFKKHKDVDINEAISIIDDTKNLVLIDTREQKERKAGHIANDVNIPMSQLKSKINTFDKDKNILLYCRNGSRSSYACKLFTKAGFEKVYNLKGGFNLWQKSNLPIKAT